VTRERENRDADRAQDNSRGSGLGRTRTAAKAAVAIGVNHACQAAWEGGANPKALSRRTTLIVGARCGTIKLSRRVFGPGTSRSLDQPAAIPPPMRRTATRSPVRVGRRGKLNPFAHWESPPCAALACPRWAGIMLRVRPERRGRPLFLVVLPTPYTVPPRNARCPPSSSSTSGSASRSASARPASSIFLICASCWTSPNPPRPIPMARGTRSSGASKKPTEATAGPTCGCAHHFGWEYEVSDKDLAAVNEYTSPSPAET